MMYQPKRAKNVCGGPLTLRDAMDMGYALTGELSYQVGYVSRKSKVNDETAVYIAGRGERAGQLFILTPCFTSTRYCFRQYLRRGNQS